MKVTVVVFPGSSRPVTVESDGESMTLADVLTKADVTPVEGEKADIAINGAITTNMSTTVADGTVVTKTKRIAGA